MMQTYRGSCHCGRVQFEVDADIDHVRSCDCSICRRRGALIHRVEPDRFRLLTPIADLQVYRWNTRTGEDYFCPTCGILPFRRPRHRTSDEIASGAPDFMGWAVNVRCLEGVDLDGIPVRRVHGSKLP